MRPATPEPAAEAGGAGEAGFVIVAPRLKPAGDDHRLVARIRKHLRPRGRRRDVLADDFDGLRGNAETNEPSTVAGRQTHGEIAARVAEQQVVALHVQERCADPECAPADR